MDREEMADLLDDVRAFVYFGDPPEAAVARLGRRANLSQADCSTLLEEYRRLGEQYIELTDPRVLRSNSRVESWYAGPDFPGAWCWPAYKKKLQKSGWKKESIDRLDEASTKILAHLSHPSRSFETRGLVVGYVQSGKTANYSALIAKAADVGYRLFIVLSGTTSSLRQQTQRRLEDDIVSSHRENWQRFTGPYADFGFFQCDAAMLNPKNVHGRVLAVVKKNKLVLEKLHEFLKDEVDADVLAGCPVLIIDDEADNASVNTSPDARSAINKAIIEICTLLKKAAYVGYTATPFANILIDPSSPQDLFPRHFIFDLPRPDGYFGTEAIFGRNLLWFDPNEGTFDGLDIVRTVSAEEERALKPKRVTDRATFEPEMPGSLRNAVAYFFLATACRYARGQDRHSSMLVHTSQLVRMHDRLHARLEQSVAEFKGTWRSQLAKLRSQWEKEADATRALANGTIDFDEIVRWLPDVLERCQVVVHNGLQGSQLSYPKDGPGQVYIAVGGNTLARGLTLEGLVVSYFVRVAGAYDTLLQMGRWFGYRFGYEDLPRIWMTEELEEYFFFLAGIEEEIRQDIERLEKEGKTPLELAIRIRTHPKLQITAKQKMGSARITSASYSNKRLQSFLFRHQDRDWLSANTAAGRQLITRVSRDIEPEPRGTATLFREVDAEHVIAFLRAYSFHEDHSDLRRDLLLKYIDAERAQGSLTRWNVGILGRDGTDGRDELGAMELGLNGPVPCINRSRFKRTAPCNIKALTSAPDRTIDLKAESGRLTETERVELRNAQAPTTGLLLLYPISKDSRPESIENAQDALCERCGAKHLVPRDSAPVRHILGAEQHILGAALVFPASKVGDETYVAANLSAFLMPDDIDAEDAAEIEAELDREVSG